MAEPEGGQARAEALMGAYIDLCNQIRLAFLTQQGDLMVLRARESSVLRLQQAVNENSIAQLYLETKVLTTIIRTGRRGRPRIEIQPEFLVAATELRGPGRIAPVVGVSTRTVRRRQLEAGLREPGLPVSVHHVDDTGERVTSYPGRRSNHQAIISDQQLDDLLQEGLTLFPTFGQQMQDGFLRSRGFQVPRERTRAAFLRVNGAPAEFGRRRIERRRYNVAGPNSLWHHDGHHKLIRYKFITHAFVDGYSRMVVGIHTVNNNRAATVLQLFRSAVQLFGRPRRLRGDYGVENVDVARDQEAAQPEIPGAYIFGRSVHNVRIERLWVDVNNGYIRKWKDGFADLEDNHGLNIEFESHIWLLHYLFLDAINVDAQDWADAWNAHKMRLPNGQRGGRSPKDLYIFGMVEHGTRGLDDEHYNGDPENYGVDWADLDNDNLAQHRLQGENDVRLQMEELLHLPHNPFLRAPPPRFSRVIVAPPQDSPLTPGQIQQLEDHLSHHWNSLDRSMDNQRRKWNIALQFATMLGGIDR